MFYVPDPRVTCHCTRSDLMAIGTNWRRSSGGGGSKCSISFVSHFLCWRVVVFVGVYMLVSPSLGLQDEGTLLCCPLFCVVLLSPIELKLL